MSKPFILIAEDDVDDRMLLVAAFEEGNVKIEMEFVSNGTEVLDYLEQTESGKYALPRFILMDLNMPRKDGRETLKEIKQHPIYKRIPVIIFTTTKNEVEINRCYDLGANTYIVKPDSFDQLRKIAEALNTYWISTAAAVVY